MTTSLKSIQMNKFGKWWVTYLTGLYSRQERLRMLQNIHTCSQRSILVIHLWANLISLQCILVMTLPWVELNTFILFSVSWTLAALSSHFWASDYPLNCKAAQQCSLMRIACALCSKPAVGVPFGLKWHLKNLSVIIQIVKLSSIFCLLVLAGQQTAELNSGQPFG